MNSRKIFLFDKTAKSEDPNERLIKYISLMVHELRNPLAGIKLSLEMLESVIGKMQDPNLSTYLNIIKRSSLRINLLINEILRYPEEPVIEESYSIQKILDDVLSDTADRISLNHIQVKKEYTQQDLRASGNVQKIKIAVTNIIVNAIDAMDRGKGELKICTRVMPGTHLVEIADNGCGISEENLEHIFNPYFTNKPGGIGIGLAATHEILKSNHIGINVQSQLDKGTVFRLFFNQTLFE